MKKTPKKADARVRRVPGLPFDETRVFFRITNVRVSASRSLWRLHLFFVCENQRLNINR